MGKRFTEVEHTADIAIRVWGRDLGELFANAAYGMACQMGVADEAGEPTEREIELEAIDTETLLVDWLQELLYLSERDDLLFTEFDVPEVSSTRLRAVARGRPVEKHRRHIKAATFSDLEVVETDGGYETRVVFDV